jgi:hypothetical protein
LSGAGESARRVLDAVKADVGRRCPPGLRGKARQLWQALSVFSLMNAAAERDHRRRARLLLARARKLHAAGPTAETADILAEAEGLARHLGIL